MKQEELNKIIENHQHWLKGDIDGWETMRANLSFADLSCADLSCADLRSADLRYADLSCADLRSANLRYADLSCADLRSANLRYADLSCANLRSANLRSADLRYADLSYADLSCANLWSADLSYANLWSADLSCADLRSANLSCADLRSANLMPVIKNEITVFYDLQCPEEGDFFAFKKASGKIVKLRIPAEARRSSATTRKCRAEFADVLEILNIDRTKSDVTEVPSDYSNKVIYKVGERVTADSWDADRWHECSHGIHFFITFDEAAIY